VTAFFDTNVLVYAMTGGPRGGVARGRLRHGGVISTQVLNEFVRVSRKKLELDWSIVEAALARTLSEGQGQHEIRSDVSAEDLAQMIVRTFAGMATFSRQGNRTDVFKTVLQLVRSKP